MLRSLYTAATGMDAEQTKMDTIAHNLANVGTAGFKKSRADFEELISERIRTAGAPLPNGGTQPSPLEVGLGTRVSSTVRSFSQGDMLNTGNPMDIAIEGTGFMRVQRENGEIAYTRAGNLRVDGEGRIVNQAGQPLDPPLTVPDQATELTFQKNGTVFAKIAGRVEPQELGQIELTTFTNPAGLESIGGNLFQATISSGDALHTRPGEDGTGYIAQGYLEGSNVKAVEEMVDMISTQRAYELNSKVIQTADQMLQRLTSLR